MPPAMIPLSSLNRSPCSEMAMQVMLRPHRYNKMTYSTCRIPSPMVLVLASGLGVEGQCLAQSPDPDLSCLSKEGSMEIQSNSCSLLETSPSTCCPAFCLNSVCAVILLSSPFEKMGLLWAAGAHPL